MMTWVSGLWVILKHQYVKKIHSIIKVRKGSIGRHQCAIVYLFHYVRPTLSLSNVQLLGEPLHMKIMIE